MFVVHRSDSVSTTVTQTTLRFVEIRDKSYEGSSVEERTFFKCILVGP